MHRMWRVSSLLEAELEDLGGARGRRRQFAGLGEMPSGRWVGVCSGSPVLQKGREVRRGGGAGAGVNPLNSVYRRRCVKREARAAQDGPELLSPRCWWWGEAAPRTWVPRGGMPRLLAAGSSGVGSESFIRQIRAVPRALLLRRRIQQ